MFISFSRERVLALAHLSATEHRRKTVCFLPVIIAHKKVDKKKGKKRERKGKVSDSAGL